MAESDKDRNFSFGTLICLIIAVIVLRVNLPPASVSGALDLSGLEKKSWFSRVAGGTAIKLMVSDSVAGWIYRDFVVIRVATSKKLDAIAIGLPFCKWQIFSNNDEE